MSGALGPTCRCSVDLNAKRAYGGNLSWTSACAALHDAPEPRIDSFKISTPLSALREPLTALLPPFSGWVGHFRSVPLWP